MIKTPEAVNSLYQNKYDKPKVQEPFGEKLEELKTYFKDMICKITSKITSFGEKPFNSQEKIKNSGIKKLIPRVAFSVALLLNNPANVEAGCRIIGYNQNNHPLYECTRPEKALNTIHQRNIVLEEPVNDYYREQIANGNIISPEDNTKYQPRGRYIPEGSVRQSSAPVAPAITQRDYRQKTAEAHKTYENETHFWKNVMETGEQSSYDKQVTRMALKHVLQGRTQNEKEWEEYQTNQQYWKNQQAAEKEWKTPRSNLEVSTGYYDTRSPSNKGRVMNPDAYMRFKGDDMIIHPDGSTAGVIRAIKKFPKYVRDAAGNVYEVISD